jgi:hypothetical protein
MATMRQPVRDSLLLFLNIVLSWIALRPWFANLLDAPKHRLDAHRRDVRGLIE